MTDHNTAVPSPATSTSTTTAITAVKPIWMKQAEEAKQKSEAEQTAVAKAAFDATFKALTYRKEKAEADSDSDSDSNEEDDEIGGEDLANKPLGPVDPAKCTAAGAGIAGGAACAASTFVVVTKDGDERKVPHGGAQVRVRVSPGVGVGGTDQEGIVKDMGDGTYSVTYVVPKRGNYMVNIECNGKVIAGSPFPVFFSAGTTSGGLLGMAPASTYPNMINQTMPNMPNYLGSVSGSFPGIGMIPGIVAGPSGGAILPGIGASLGELCREYINGQCAKTDCKFNHPPHNLLMTALAATTAMGTLSQVPMAPSAAAMAAAQAIVAAQALQAHAAQVQAQTQSNKDASGPSDKARKEDALKRTLQVSNLSSLLTVDQLQQLFGFCGTVVECTITDSKHFAYIEYSKPEEATAALAMNNMDVGGRPLNVEMAKSLPQKPQNSSVSSSSLPMMMQQAVAMQQMQFQQALIMQQTMNAQQAANRAATMKSATELAAARAAEISAKLKADGFVIEEIDTNEKSRSASPSRARSRSKSKSPANSRRRRMSPSYSPPPRHNKDQTSRSPFRSRYHLRYDNERRSHRNYRGDTERSRRRDLDRSYDRHSPVSRRNRSRSASPRNRKAYRDDSSSPKHRREISSHTARKSPSHRRGSRSSPRNDSDNKLKYRKRSRSAEDSIDRATDSRVEKSKERRRRRSRSSSVDGKHRGSRSSPKKIDGSRSKHRRRSRSRSKSAEVKDQFDDDESRDEKLKRHDRKRSRSKSVEDRYRSREKVNENRDRKSRHQERRRSRSLSADNRHQRRSRSSPKCRDESESKQRRPSRSISPDEKCRSNHRPDEKSKSKLQVRSRSNSVEHEHKSNVERGIKKNRKVTNHDHVSTEESGEEPDSTVKDSTNMKDGGNHGMLGLKNEDCYAKESMKSVLTSDQYEEKRFMPNVTAGKERFSPKSGHPLPNLAGLEEQNKSP